MLINHDTKQIILTPFKNWTTSSIEYFHGKGWKNIETLHPYISGDSRNSHKMYCRMGAHGNIPPHNYSRYERILLLRNPYKRVVSMWKFIYQGYYKTTFEEFFEKTLTSPICLPVMLTYPSDTVVRTEHFVEDFKKANINIDEEDFPHLNQCKTPMHTLTEMEKEKIYWLHKTDFDAGNYEK